MIDRIGEDKKKEQIPEVNKEIYSRFFRLLYQKGILLPPSSFETIFISAAHSEQDIKDTLEIVEWTLKKV